MNVPDGPRIGSVDAPRVVLDTNVCLDLLLFDDPRVAALAQALQSRQLIAVANADTRAEWRRVLGYPALGLDPQHQDELIKAFDTLVADVGNTPPAALSITAALPLPRCVDPDDQKFLELARDAGARWLLSRDRDLLVLAARCRRAGLFSVLSPQAWATGLSRSLAS
ncbi:putative toxin-antitoxin system toxin component, PIN family [Novilysobacter antarcticus]|uniref:putative toxin-antitoxin system toxin component, PIN family n=1 Tax=Novilysobacter antarcticus TaxID=2862543 RepID=UPI001FEB5F58|nr:putative toxin-antitoxin system toxin component, PIN family [Lysobacter antarcticus]